MSESYNFRKTNTLYFKNVLNNNFGTRVQDKNKETNYIKYS